nr:hypothetical protein CFP56_43483 [Quercus suber]
MGENEGSWIAFSLRRHRLSTWRPMDRFVESRSRMPTENRRRKNMLRSKNHALSSEEEAELERSNKKVKDRQAPRGNTRAYNQAFAFDEKMEADIESDKEMKEQRERFTSVKLSKDVKHRIRVV